MDITKDIQDAIAKNLPGAVGAELQAVLAQGKADAIALAKSTAEIVDLKARIKGLDGTVEALTRDLTKHGELAARESTVAARENGISIRELQQELAAEKRISQFATDTVSRLVRNVEYRNTSVGSMPVAVPATPPNSGNSYGSPAFLGSGPTSDNTTTTAE